MATATATTPRKLKASRAIDPTRPGLAIVGGSVCVILTLALAAGHVVGAGAIALAAAGFLVLVGWCLSHRRVDQTLIALGLYVGLLDGYVKLRTGSSTITLARDLLVVAIATGALLRAMRSERQLMLPPLGGLVLAFCAVVVVELFNPQARSAAGGLAGVRQHLEFVPLFFLGYAFLRRETQLQKLLLILVLCAAVGGVVSYIQSTLTPQELAGWGPGYRERVIGSGAFTGAGRVAFDAAGNPSVRPFGLGSDSGAGALAAAVALPGLIALFMGGRTLLRAAMIPLSIGIALAVATSGSRAALITVFVSAVAFGVLAAASRNALRVVVGLAVGALLIYGAFQQLGSTNSTTERARTIAPTRAFSTFSAERGSSVAKFGGYAYQYPLGVGVGSVGPAATVGTGSVSAEDLDSETQWNFLVLETGLFGVAIFVALLFTLMWHALTRVRPISDPRLRLQLAALAAPIFGLVVAGFAGPFSTSVPAAPYFWLIAGVLSYWLVSNRPNHEMAKQ